jgi:endonuclease/exonuclease/phosphatase family metal-dependent hydrolase
VISSAEWEVCLLQEVPPAWGASLAEESRASPFRVLTSRNELGLLTRLIGKWNPDLIASWEGGSTLTLVRPPWRIVPESKRSLLLNPFPERGLHERRRMSFARLERRGEGLAAAEVCVANLHASGNRRRAEREVRRAAAAATAWASGLPLVLGGDFNLRPRSSSTFDELALQSGLRPPTAPDAIDHLLARGLELIEPPTPWPVEQREVEVQWDNGKRRIRLSDHDPAQATFGVAARGDSG